QFAHNCPPLPTYPPSSLRQHKRRCRHTRASAQHSWPHKRHILQRHVALLAHPVPYNSFSTKFYRKTQRAPHSTFALVEWQNREVWLVSPIHSRAIVPQHLVRPLSIFLYQCPRSRFSPHPYTCYSS